MADGEALGVGVSEGLGDVEGVGDGEGSGPTEPPLRKSVSDITYTTKDANKITQTNRTINPRLPIFHLHWNTRLISIGTNKVLA